LGPREAPCKKTSAKTAETAKTVDVREAILVGRMGRADSTVRPICAAA